MREVSARRDKHYHACSPVLTKCCMHSTWRRTALCQPAPVRLQYRYLHALLTLNCPCPTQTAMQAYLRAHAFATATAQELLDGFLAPRLPAVLLPEGTSSGTVLRSWQLQP